MACACKNRHNGQVSSVKQVVKKPQEPQPKQETEQRTPVVKRIIYKRPI